MTDNCAFAKTIRSIDGDEMIDCITPVRSPEQPQPEATVKVGFTKPYGDTYSLSNKLCTSPFTFLKSISPYNNMYQGNNFYVAMVMEYMGEGNEVVPVVFATPDSTHNLNLLLNVGHPVLFIKGNTIAAITSEMKDENNQMFLIADIPYYDLRERKFMESKASLFHSGTYYRFPVLLHWRWRDDTDWSLPYSPVNKGLDS